MVIVMVIIKTTEETSWVKDKYPEKGYKENEGKSFFQTEGHWERI